MTVHSWRAPLWAREPIRAGSRFRPRTWLVTGATGFIGRLLCRRLIERGERVIALVRNRDKAWELFGPQLHIVTSLTELAADERVHVIVNLGGAPIMARRWTSSRRTELLDSRVQLTAGLCRWIAGLERRPEVLINASAIGYYGIRGDEEITEAERGQPIFQSHLCQNWELAAQAAKHAGTRVCCLRFGLVLGREGGAFPGLAAGARARVSTVLGTGTQWVSWIHVEDLLRLIEFCVEHKELQGGVNATAPAPVRQLEFASALSRAIGTAVPVRVPGRILRAVLGERAQLLVDGQRVVPTRALSAGFAFRFPTIDTAARDLLAPAGDVAPLQVMYDPECPVCDAEMSRYCRDADRAGREWSFHDVADRPELMLRYGLNTDMARRRVYVLADDGRMVSGIRALLLIWRNLPRWRLLARFVSLPGVLPLAETFYDRLLAPTIWKGNELRRARAAMNARAVR